ncbi:uncharacterized protein TRAVEDRAFT_132309 [Trametes versicolor FP-101664 SS1]|uniref:uncharacterized protein n=1 Tax=Trametes versicolor (strain FP-101664) TaxID=717944 RepID=UPI00046220B9|nr:uncharacterized protein TRAVEDRAFT_132309 [Trametes versicolor FP-101664 SS1]EIW53977.1 hypothetical protein TRAVEDRAFT_132309 [Trametes versicolor FP-101664 SS1]
MSLLVLRLGGRKLLYSMSHYISLPSIRSLRRAKVFTKLMPSLGTPKVEEALFNIKQIFDPKMSELNTARHPARTGSSLMMDEISVEEKSEYFPHTDSVGGFCREHSASVNTRLSTFDNAVNMAHRLHDGTLHYGKEASVIAVGSFAHSSRLRGAFPILMSPTCKTESPHGSAAIVTKVLRALEEAGLRDLLGDVWSFASDGDAGRRAMVYDLFMEQEVTDGHSLYPLVGGLTGLNRFVGHSNITADFDWKHELKRTSDI